MLPRKRVRGNRNKLRNVKFNPSTIKIVYNDGGHTGTGCPERLVEILKT